MPPPATPSPRTISSGLRRYLYGTSAVTGAAVMVVEILGAKLLSPYVGTSHFVWTAQIAVTLVSLASGYWFGGWLVDRSAALHRLYAAILLAGLYLAGTVPIVPRVAFAALALPLPLASLVASAFLFFVPLTLLATVGPFVVRVLTANLTDVGRVVGRLSAVSTLGSVIGTVLIGYVVIPYVPNAITMVCTAIILLAVALGYFAVWNRTRTAQLRGTAAGLVGLVAAGTAIAFDGRPRTTRWNELARRNSNFGEMLVLDERDGSRRYFLTDWAPQNAWDPVRRQSAVLFTYGLHALATTYAPRVDDVLVIGLGVGVVPMDFVRDGARVDAVEINGAMVPLAATYFDFDPQRIALTVGDGRQFLNVTTRQYDVVILDAFLGDGGPSHLLTREAFDAVRRVLHPDGVLVVNTLGDFTPGRDFFATSLHATLRATFGAVALHHDGSRNLFYVATPAPTLAPRRTPDLTRVHPEVRPQLERVLAGRQDVDPHAGMVLRDDFNPVDVRDAANRERFRRKLLQWAHPDQLAG